jgi:ribosomal protein S4E
MASKSSPDAHVVDGDYCVAVGGTHAGKSGIVQDRRTSKTGHITITVSQDDGVRFKTLAKNVQKRPRPRGRSA